MPPVTSAAFASVAATGDDWKIIEMALFTVVLLALPNRLFLFLWSELQFPSPVRCHQLR
ncbi:hypothetical protein [Cylindrospermopsis raciborskii]|uniref:hypothetical protein n=1 Tax=Cylindrospermopsis raciborskii TaxID=77022 RepID=UPI002ED8360D